ncbi:hypothetical protein A3D00_02845 [Candidatus Woesebacteria bacterium RIFCSPHIGHO2_02_FULL_38_9]|uniref:SpoVT-AbrB domain-containing protein n=1 Tax=Candidatus Woesebacteria bacterium RIFCSPHIGHO2_01_FULL_39_28 TaxID=1802496 RepID=A0A1F7YHS4_9BACT|nr:MAG: hypothetical protein A2627_03805 [Candidatus Woesebacteria bacterium RIFCSPHIGHO2_01_FULL_39_28]OGM35324.1 MAG: hypothetical protein A3D00_02845 [Candidatus Woesebacteria bacterium RIFCSPHIGHO2_02_FULL_38_9]OGM58548.1 MAG: hypothetical protein A3A50_00815 [Candidatus Woesebacteria bacterium RIFCSPLOWO2_01_FULL_38_20]
MQQLVREEIVRLQPKGVFTIPKKLREGLFDDFGIAKIKRVGRRLIVEPVRTLTYPVRSYTDSDLKGFFELDEKESKILKDKGLI